MHGYNNQKTSYGGTYSQGFYPAGGAVPPPPPETGYTTHLGAGQGYPAPPYGYQGYYPYQAPEDYSAYNGGQDASANPDVAESTPVNDARAQLEAVQRCHMHTKPDLNCKFCRKYKSAVHELSRLAAQQDKNEQSEKPNQLPMTNSSTYNLNTLLRNNILNSEYYKSLAAMNSHMDVLNELVQYADHAEPYCSTATRAPSTLFCCLHKLFTLRLTEKQMVSLIDCNKSPYPRCCGFLYLRFVLPSDQLWDWFEPYFMDDEPFVVSVNPSRSTTIGEFCEKLLVDEKYFNTVLPRLPVRFKNKYGAQLCQMSEHRKRRVRNLDVIDDFCPGKTISACIRGDWVEAEIESVGHDYPVVNLVLTNGDKESVDIAYVSLKKPSSGESKRSSEWERTRDRSRSGSPSGSRKHRLDTSTDHSGHSKDDLLREFKRRQSEKAVAVGKDYGKRPSSFKSSLSSKMGHKYSR